MYIYICIGLSPLPVIVTTRATTFISGFTGDTFLPATILISTEKGGQPNVCINLGSVSICKYHLLTKNLLL